jgi:dihydrofolate reductase
MRRIIVSNLVSLDGFFEGPNREIDWFNVGEDFFDYVRELFSSIDTILYGRETYEQMASYWPTPQADAELNDPAIIHKMNHLNKIVFSDSLQTADWNNSSIIKNVTAEKVAELKQQEGKDMVIFGSGTLVSQLTNWKLIDEYRIIINPLVLGKGHSMFNGVKGRVSLQLTDAQRLSTGSVILYYEPV